MSLIAKIQQQSLLQTKLQTQLAEMSYQSMEQDKHQEILERGH
jgi:hypothetical protein